MDNFKITVSDINKSFSIRSEKRSKKSSLLEVLKDVSFSVREGEFLAIVGPSGCGKSTLLDIMAALTEPSSGACYIDGKEKTEPDLNCGFVMQQYALLPWRNVRKNIALSLEVKGMKRKSREVQIEKYIDLVGLSGFQNAHPHELSGGMRQRVAIARALAHEPAILLMDEPFAALDQQTRELLQDELLRIWGETGKTIIFVTHSIDEAVLLADRVVVLTERPGSVKRIVDIDLPRPRTNKDMRQNSHFVELKNDIYNLI